MPLSSTLRFLFKHWDPTGKVLSTDTFDVKIQSDGSVLAQTFPFSTMNVLGVKESLRISVTPLDRDFPFSTANISITYTPQAGT